MPPHDPAAHDPASSAESRAAQEIPDDVSRGEGGSVSTAFEPGTGRRIKTAVGISAACLGVAFAAVLLMRWLDQRAVARAGERAYGAVPPVDVVTAHAATGAQDLVLPAQTAAWYDTTLYARVGGYVARWLCDIGDHVKKGQVLAIIETPELDAELSAARASLRASQAQVSARQAEAAFSKSTHERWRDSPKGVVSDQEREAKRADYEAAQARLYAAEAQVALDQSRVQQYRALAEFKQVTAPFDGTITERKIDVGNLVTAGSASTTTPLYRISQTDPLRVFVEVPQSAAGDLMKPGVPARIRAPGASDTFTGKTARAAEAMNPEARTMRVEVDMPNGDRRLVPGMYVNVAFHLEPRGAVEVPAAALIFRPTGALVAKVDRQSHVHFADVAIARDDGNMVELAAGVQAGDRLVLNISSQIAAGQAVIATDIATVAAAGWRTAPKGAQ